MSKASDHGFSLIEVVVALGVLSTAAIGFSTFSRDSTAGVRQLEARYLARAVAEAQLVDVFTDEQPLEIGAVSGASEQIGREFEWVRTVSASTQEGLFLVTVQVSEAGEDNIVLELTTLKSGDL